VKFVFFAVLSKYLSVEDYGDYSLITTTITISIFVLGLDFYNFSLRNILTNKEDATNKIFNTFILYFIIYFVFIVFGILFLDRISFIDNNSVLIIMLLCITEHLNQEIYRLQIAFKKVLTANIIFFIRVFGWTSYMLIGLLVFDIEASIDNILRLWVIFNLIAVVLNTIVTWKQIPSITKLPKFDLGFLKVGLKISFLFFLGTLSLKSIEYINRYIVDLFLGRAETGIFAFYSNIAIIITVYINSIVISFELPVIIEKSKAVDLMSYFRKFEKSLLTQIIVISVAILIIIKPILLWQDVEGYDQYFMVLIFLLIGVGLMNYSLCYHFFLYVKKQDKKIFTLTIKSGIINLVATITLTHFFGMYGTSVGFMITGLYMFYIRRKSAKGINYG